MAAVAGAEERKKEVKKGGSEVKLGVLSTLKLLPPWPV